MVFIKHDTLSTTDVIYIKFPICSSWSRRTYPFSLSRNTSVIVSKLSITRLSATCTHALLLVPRFGFGEPELLNGLSTCPPFMQLLSSLSTHSISFHANHSINVAVAISWVFPPSARSARWPPTTVPRMPRLRSSPALLDRDCYIFTRLQCAGSPQRSRFLYQWRVELTSYH